MSRPRVSPVAGPGSPGLDLLGLDFPRPAVETDDLNPATKKLLEGMAFPRGLSRQARRPLTGRWVSGSARAEVSDPRSCPGQRWFYSRRRARGLRGQAQTLTLLTGALGSADSQETVLRIGKLVVGGDRARISSL